jgi:hypothetical protein
MGMGDRVQTESGQERDESYKRIFPGSVLKLTDPVGKEQGSEGAAMRMRFLGDPSQKDTPLVHAFAYMVLVSAAQTKPFPAYSLNEKLPDDISSGASFQKDDHGKAKTTECLFLQAQPVDFLRSEGRDVSGKPNYQRDANGRIRLDIAMEYTTVNLTAIQWRELVEYVDGGETEIAKQRHHIFVEHCKKIGCLSFDQLVWELYKVRGQSSFSPKHLRLCTESWFVEPKAGFPEVFEDLAALIKDVRTTQTFERIQLYAAANGGSQAPSADSLGTAAGWGAPPPNAGQSAGWGAHTQAPVPPGTPVLGTTPQFGGGNPPSSGNGAPSAPPSAIPSASGIPAQSFPKRAF